MEPKKDPKILLEAFSASNFEKNVHLVMIGNGELGEELKKEYHHFANVHFQDFVNQMQMPAIYQIADVFVLPSKGPGETWGLSINEAMANGKAIIASDKCGCATDLVEDGINGYLFKANHMEDLRDKMKLIYSNRDSLGMMQRHSKNTIQWYSIGACGNCN